MIFRTNHYFPLVIMLAFVFNNTIVGYRLFDISYDRMIELVIFILLFPVLMKDVQKDYKYKDIYVLFIIMIFCLILHSFIAFSQEAPYVPPTDIFRDLVRMFFFVILLMLINFSVVRNTQSINIYLIGMFVWVLFVFL